MNVLLNRAVITGLSVKESCGLEYGKRKDCLKSVTIVMMPFKGPAYWDDQSIADSVAKKSESTSMNSCPTWIRLCHH